MTKALDKAIRTEGLKVVILLRLCPLIPFTAFNYVMGVTAVSFFDYAVGGFGMIPGTIVYVSIGSTIGSIQDVATGNYDAGAAPLIFLIVGSIAACVAIIYVSIVVKRYLNSAMEDEEAGTGTNGIDAGDAHSEHSEEAAPFIIERSTSAADRTHSQPVISSEELQNNRLD